jgi:amidophosphoribosyltransferase
MIRRCGVEAVYMASTCPPIRFPCYYGIDFPDVSELVAATHPNEADLASMLGVDALVYQTLSGLKTALGDTPLCTACLTGDYPTDITDAQHFAENRERERLACIS